MLWDDKIVHFSIFLKKVLTKDSTIFIYGGNLGKPQGVNFLLNVIDSFKSIYRSHLLIIGSGTEFERIKQQINKYKRTNVGLYHRLSKVEYDSVLSIADVGLIFLDKRFTIPNFPSRLTSYMEFSLPVLAATDKNTDLKDVLYKSGSGFWLESGDINSFIKYANILSKDFNLRKKMGLNGRKYLENNYNIKKNINKILDFLREEEFKYVQK